jgi:hypothetical protein
MNIEHVGCEGNGGGGDSIRYAVGVAVVSAVEERSTAAGLTWSKPHSQD